MPTESLFKDAFQEYDQKYQNLIDYVCLIGPKTEDLNNMITSINQGNHKVSYIPTVLSKIPEINRPSISFPNQIIEFLQLNFSKTLNKVDFPIKVEITHKKDIQFQNFVITSADGQIVHACAMIFSEDLNSIQEGLQGYQNMQKMNMSSNDQSYANSSKMQDHSQFNLSDRTSKHQQHISQAQFECSSDIDNNELLMKNKHYIQKALCVISRYPFVEKFKVMLQDIKYLSESGMSAPIEDYLAHIVYSIPAPLRLRCHVNIQIQRPLIFYLPAFNQLPYADPECIKTLFEVLDITNICHFLRRILFDSNNLMVCSDKEKLTQVGEAMRSLIFPFRLENLYIPYLPATLSDYLQLSSHFDKFRNVQVPYLMGIQYELLDEAKDKINDGTYIINLDENSISHKHFSSVVLSANGKFQKHSNDDLPEFPAPQLKAFKKTLKDKIVKKKEKDKKGKRRERLTDQEVEQVREAFLKLFIDVFEKVFFIQYWSQQYGRITPENNYNFDQSKFLECIDYEQKPFYGTFFKQQMFTQFLDRKFNPLTNDDRIDIKFFQEKIPQPDQRPSKNRQLKHLDAIADIRVNDHSVKTFLQLNKSYDPKFCKAICEDQKIMPFKRNELPEKTNSYTYKIHPQAYDQNYLRNVFLQDINFQSVLQDFHAQNSKQLGEASILQKVQYPNKRIRIQSQLDFFGIEVNIYLCWILSWASTLKYQDQNEIPIRIQELITILERLVQAGIRLNHIEIFEMLAETAYRYGTLEMALQIFDLLEEFNLKSTPSVISYVHASIMKHNQNPDQESFDERGFAFEEENQEFRPRSFLSVHQLNTKRTKAEIAMLLVEVCENCETKNNSSDLKQNVEKSSDLFIFRCKNCKRQLQPTINVRLGSKDQNQSDLVGYMSSIRLRQLLEHVVAIDRYYRNLEQVTPERLMKDHADIYWNMIFSFSELKLPIGFLIPYLDTTVESKKLTAADFIMDDEPEEDAGKFKTPSKMNRDMFEFDNMI